MGWPVYTERFISTSITGTWVAFTVPAGKRAIVKSVSALISASPPGIVHVLIENMYAVAFSIPVVYDSKSIDLLAVAYAGEQVRAYIQAPAGFVMVTGWLLDDPVGDRHGGLEVSTLPEHPPPGAG